MQGFNVLGLNVGDTTSSSNPKTQLKNILKGSSKKLDSFKEVEQAINDLKNQIENSETGGVSLDDYAKKTDIPDVSNFVTSSDLEVITKDAPEAFDTLKEIADWLQNDNNKTASDIVTAINDHSGDIEGLESRVGDLESTGFLTEHQSLEGYAKTEDIPTWAKASEKPTYTASEVGAASVDHNHDGIYAPIIHDHPEYAASDHSHKGVYADANHTHSDYLTSASFDNVVLEAETEDGGTITFTLAGIKTNS